MKNETPKKRKRQNPRKRSVMNIQQGNMLFPPQEADVTACNDDEMYRRSSVGITQYSVTSDGYRATTQTTKRLPSGVYSIFIDAYGLGFKKRNIVCDDLVRLPDSASDSVVSEIEKFWTMKDRFDSFGFSFKRGMLLWGPPGSGKTATIELIMKQVIDKDGIVILADNPIVASSALHTIRDIEPGRRIVVVLEDIDALIEMYGEASMLSLLDGEDTIDTVVFIATTNYPEKLDGRVVDRPSRFDRIIFIDVPNAAARTLFLKTKNLTDDEIKIWVSETDGFSIAHLKELIICVKCYGNDFNEEVKRIKRMHKKTASSSSTKDALGFSLGFIDDTDDFEKKSPVEKENDVLVALTDTLKDVGLQLTKDDNVKPARKKKIPASVVVAKQKSKKKQNRNRQTKNRQMKTKIAS